ncbi:methyltransferase domain-containing protein [Pseudodesulfovibrio sp. F-1]|uniref:Ribosomal protein L11 methyltransferase n=1 Tax=Pseudodesulfovibrio alkaliphilus TaxID=2661613 RepID=A0A7K1KQU8_9BACT|nr:50S ribosomal protein L11 methyltransferase [Pseudodesulfovibrio alkaliphilus]MUM78231.1 methyltransferase domain-containing protein [Pseudodesulfovibrio alkaliphilus]
MSTLLKIEFTISEEEADEAGVFIAARVPHGWEETPDGDGRRITLYLEDHPLAMEMVKAFEARFPGSGVRWSEQESENWAMAWKDFFNPVNCGGTFTILPPWLENGSENGTTHIVIEPKMAFGTGHHPTTSLCLTTIGELAGRKAIAPGGAFLDLGTGSGILGIGLAKLGLTGIGLDTDPQAVVCARENIEANGVGSAMCTAVGSIDCLDPGLPFDIVVANILSGPLIEMAGDILAHVRPGGCLILSGILADRQKDAVAETYMRLGIGKPAIVVEGEWACLVWDRVGGHRRP